MQMSQYIKKIRTKQGDLQIDYEALANLPTISNPNLLINSDFRNPINQRGQSVYTPSNAQLIYTIDRWRTKGVTVTVNNGSITLKNNNSTTWSFAQFFENPLPLDDYTLSINVLSVSGSPYMNIVYTDGTQSTPRGLGSIGVEFTIGRGSISYVNIALKAGEEMTVQWIKLERGTIATLFSPRLYVEELALCQRYYNKLQSTYPLMMTQQNAAEKYSYIPIALPVSLRDMPSIKYKNVKFLKNGVGGSWYDVETVKCVGFSKMGVTLQMDLLSTTYEVGVPYFLILPNSGYIEFDAEIY
jgi:hypothetical protein